MPSLIVSKLINPGDEAASRTFINASVALPR